MYLFHFKVAVLRIPDPEGSLTKEFPSLIINLVNDKVSAALEKKPISSKLFTKSFLQLFGSILFLLKFWLYDMIKKFF